MIFIIPYYLSLHNFLNKISFIACNFLLSRNYVKKMKRVEEDYRSLLMQYKEAKCEIETLNGELIETYSKMKSFLIKNLFLTELDWDILERVVRVSISPRK